MGCTAAIVFTCFGASYGTAKAGVGIVASGVLRPDLIVRSTLPRFFSFFFTVPCCLLFLWQTGEDSARSDLFSTLVEGVCVYV